MERLTDGDLLVDPRRLAPVPRLGDAMTAAGFAASNQPGIWIGTGDIKIDLLVPAALGGGGKRGARLGPHGNDVARKARGLEAALVDKQSSTLSSLEPSDRRSYELAVAGPSACLVAKTHKLSERTATPHRLKAKDALDVLRILRAVAPGELAERFALLLAEEVSREVTKQAIDQLRTLFGDRNAQGCRLAAEATRGLESEDTIKESCAILCQSLLSKL